MANFGLEFILTFVVVFTYFSATNPHRLTKSLDPGVTVSIVKCCEKFLTLSVPGWPGLYGSLDLLQGSSQPRQSVGACLCCQPIHLSLVRRNLKTGGSDFFYSVQGILGRPHPRRCLRRFLLPVHLQRAAAEGEHQGHGGQHEHGEQQRGGHDRRLGASEAVPLKHDAGSQIHMSQILMREAAAK